MTQKLWQKKLELNYSENVLDIIQFGSSVIDNNIPNDIDVAVIFKKIPVKEQLDETQKIKKQLQAVSELPIHIKAYDYYSFFDESNFAKEGILFYGISLITGDFFSKKFGLTPVIEISYDLRELEKKDKVRFHYLLKGKKNSSGMLNEFGGKLLNPGLIQIKPEHEKIFLDKISEFQLKFKISKKFLI
jgi:predicted nucleotidyltransferase